MFKSIIPQVRFGDRLLGSEYSDQATVRTTESGSPIDNLRDNIYQFEASSQQNLDAADSKKSELTSKLNTAENKFNSQKSDGLNKISDMSEKITKNFVGVQQKSNGKPSLVRNIH
jgi:uncharacterized protein YdaT